MIFKFNLAVLKVLKQELCIPALVFGSLLYNISTNLKIICLYGGLKTERVGYSDCRFVGFMVLNHSKAKVYKENFYVKQSRLTVIMFVWYTNGMFQSMDHVCSGYFVSETSGRTSIALNLSHQVNPNYY